MSVQTVFIRLPQACRRRTCSPLPICRRLRKLYVANGLTNDMTVIDVPTLNAEKSVPVGRLPWGVAIKP